MHRGTSPKNGSTHEKKARTRKVCGPDKLVLYREPTVRPAKAMRRNFSYGAGSNAFVSRSAMLSSGC